MRFGQYLNKSVSAGNKGICVFVVLLRCLLAEQRTIRKTTLAILFIGIGSKLRFWHIRQLWTSRHGMSVLTNSVAVVLSKRISNGVIHTWFVESVHFVCTVPSSWELCHSKLKAHAVGERRRQVKGITSNKYLVCFVAFQISALEWIRDNIHFFGGHPDTVTLQGAFVWHLTTGMIFKINIVRCLRKLP